MMYLLSKISKGFYQLATMLLMLIVFTTRSPSGLTDISLIPVK